MTRENNIKSDILQALDLIKSMSLYQTISLKCPYYILSLSCSLGRTCKALSF